jgi:hypothetical protein
MMGAILVLDLVAIAAFKLMHMDARPDRTRTTFVAAWTLVSALVAAWGLVGVRKARLAARRDRMQQRG